MKRVVSILLFVMMLSLCVIGCAAPEVAPETPALEVEPAADPAEVVASEPAPYDNIVLRYSDINASTSNNARFANKFAELVNEKTNGRVTIEVYMGGTLAGYDIEAARSGIADFIQMVPSAAYDMEPSIAILDCPYIYDDLEHMLAVNDPNSPIIEQINSKMTDTGVRLMGSFFLGARHITSNRAIYEPSDMAGMQMRVVPSVIYNAIFEAFGATPTPMAFSEVATALLTNVIDGQENPYSTIYNNKFHEVQDYVVETGHLWTLASVFMNENSYNKLTAEDQVLVKEAIAEAFAYITYDMETVNSEAREKIVADNKATLINAENGLNVEAFEALGQEVASQFAEQWGDLYNEIRAMGTN